MFCFFKQKTAYDMRISDWSSDMCSSDLAVVPQGVASVLQLAEELRHGRMVHRLARIVFQEILLGYIRHVRVLLVLGQQMIEGLEIGRASCRERVCQYV